MFAIDGVKLPSNDSKERSGTHDELRHHARRLGKAADKIVGLRQSQDLSTQEAPERAKRQARIDALRKEAQRTRQFVAANPPRLNRKGQELETNLTDPDSAKMATSKGVIQGYAAQAAADSARQIIVAADIVGPGSEQSMLLPADDRTDGGVLRNTHPGHGRRGVPQRCQCGAPDWRQPDDTASWRMVEPTSLAQSRRRIRLRY